MGDPVNTIGPGGAVIPRTAEDAAILGVPVQDPTVAEAAGGVARRQKMFETRTDAALSFAEGIVDAFTGGLVHETGEAADMRREANSGWEMAGNILGTVGALATGRGPAAFGAKLGEGAGELAAQGILRQAKGSIVSTALREAGAGTVMAGQFALGHQVLDTVIEDRPFSGEAIADSAKLGGLLGLGAGGLMGVLSKVASRGSVAAQGGRLAEDVAGHFEEARAAYGEALHFHTQQLGALEELASAGKLADVSGDFMRVRRAAVRDAREAQAALRELDTEAALSGRDPAAYKELQRRWSDYHEALATLDDVMTPQTAERSYAEAAAEPGTGVFRRPEEPVTPDMVVRSESTARPPVTQVSAPPLGDFTGPAPSAERLGQLDRQLIAPELPTQSAPAAGGTQVGKMSAANTLVDESAGRLPLATSEQSGQAAASATQMMAQRGISENAIRRDVEVMWKEARRKAGQPVGKAEMGRAAQAEYGKTGVFDAAPGGKTVVDEVPEAKLAQALDDARASEKTGIKRVVQDAVKEATNTAQVTQRLLDDWMEQGVPRSRPWHEAQARAQSAMDALYAKAGGRFDSARAIGILEEDGIRPSTNSVGSYLDAAYSLGRTGRLVADEARGVATPLRSALSKALGDKLTRAALGHKFGGMAGALLGFTQFGGKLASATGELAQRIADATQKFLTTTKVRSVVAPVAANRPWAYSERGPIADPVERIQEIQFLASNPDAIRARVRNAAGNLALAAPEHVRAMEDVAVRQMTHLAVRAPAIYFDRLGRPLQPPQGKMRQFLEYENAANDLDTILKSLAAGQLTPPQADALKTAWSSVQVRVTQGMLADPEKLQRFNRSKLRLVEMVTGMPLTGASDPNFLMRQQAAWMAAQPPAPQPISKPQAFNINPDGAPTPSQANAQGRAPGN